MGSSKIDTVIISMSGNGYAQAGIQRPQAARGLVG